MSEDRHPGISMHKLPVGGGFVGILFAVGCAAIFVLGLPSLWYFVAFSAALGIAIAALIRFFQQDTEDRHKPLSILGAKEIPANMQKAKPRNNGNMFHAVPRPVQT
jgi:membrane protein implicated in regulation of membrane protease activity